MKSRHKISNMEGERTCRLCLAPRVLQRSHLLPRAIYRDLRTPSLLNPNPLLTSGGQTEVGQEQVTVDLLCADCEERFNRNGERWVLANGYRLAGPSNLYRLLSEAVPHQGYPDGTVYAGRDIAGLNIQQLGYFGISVFWRAAVAPWEHTGQDGPLLSLGSYEHSIRAFLLGTGPFPTVAALWVAVMRTATPPPVMTFPRGGSRGMYHQHNFDIPGLSFTLFVGRQLPQHAHELCAIHSPSGFVFFSPVQDLIDEHCAKLFHSAKLGLALRRLNEKVGVRAR